jgi:outer membrane protein assembly factor BamA
LIRVVTRRPVLAVLCLAAAALVPSAGRAQSSEDREVTGLRFEGNEAFSGRDLAAVIETQKTRCKSFLLQPFCWVTNWGFAHNRAYLDEDELPIDLLRLRIFYRQRGYRAASVDTVLAREEEEVDITFLVAEGIPTPIDSLIISGVEGILDTARVRRQMELEPGAPFDRVRLQAGKDDIATRLQNLGYMDAVVLEDAFLPPGGGARINIKTTPGTRYRVGDIDVNGAEDIGENIVRRFLTFRSGEFYSQEGILDSQRNLFALDAVRFASIGRSDDRSFGDTLVNINVQVTPARPRVARAGGGWSTDRCLQTEARLTDRNFFGGARKLELTARLGNIFASTFNGGFPCADVGQERVFWQLNYLLQLEFLQPYFISERNSFRSRLYAQRESVPDVFVRTAVGAEASVTRRLQRRMSVSLAYRPEYGGFDEQSADIFFCVNFGICRRDDIQLISEPTWLAPLALSWLYNRTNSPFAPTNGYYIAAEGELAGKYTGSQWRYGRLALQAANFEELKLGLVLAARLRWGVVQPTQGLVKADSPESNDLVNPVKRFFAGGPQSVRGFGWNLLGPTVLVLDAVEDCEEGVPLQQCAEFVAATDPNQFVQRPVGGNSVAELSIELRQDLGRSWRLVGFLDMGQVFESFSKIEAPILTPGIGIRYVTPVGPFRLDIGYNPSSATLLPVVATLPNGDIVELDNPVRYDPFTYDDPSLLTQFWRRLRFHFSIGEAF